ncbi:DUF3857 domain-containing protein [Ohtaekwangia sp.]|uniref:DUF3857 domain-containing protein n=1 Tax=Ohtaekwangia sp. TaxID=2066019 RepID=UPI002FDDE382
MKKMFIVAGLCLLAASGLQAQSSEIEKKIKEELWSTCPPEFKVTAVPEKWKDESAVVLAYHREYICDFTTKVWGMGSVNRFYIEKLNYHYRIKLQDKAAVVDFSDIAFDNKKIKSNLFGKASAYKVIGIKVIKPNGTEKEVDLSQAVKADASSDKDLKIPIPNLETGDIIDYFIAVRDESLTKPEFGDEYLLEAKYPIVSNTITFSIPHQFNFYYDSYNGAPSFKKEQKDNDVIYTLKDAMREKAPDILWHYAYQSAPHFRYSVTDGESKPDPELKARKVLGMSFNPSDIGTMVDFMNDNFKKTKDQKLILNEMYFLLRNPIYMKAYYGIELGDPLNAQSPANFFMFADKFLDRYNIGHDLLLAPSRDVAPWERLVNLTSCEFFMRINTTPPVYLSAPTPFSLPGDIYYMFEGSEYTNNYGSKHELPISTEDQNATLSTLAVSFDADNTDQLKITRNVLAKGHNKAMHQYLIFTNYDYMKAYDLPKYQAESSRLIGGILKDFNKEKTKYSQRLTQDYNERDERIKKNLEEELEAKVVEYKNLNIKTIGMWQDTPNTEYSDEFVLENITRKAGGNVIIELGKLIEKQTEIKEDQKIRTRDIYMAYPRSFNHEIIFTVPEGYTVEGIDAFNKKVENKTGGFVSTARVDGNKLTVKSRKYYTQNTYPATDWTELLPFLTASNDLFKAKILLKKI